MLRNSDENYIQVDSPKLEDQRTNPLASLKQQNPQKYQQTYKKTVQFAIPERDQNLQNENIPKKQQADPKLQSSFDTEFKTYLNEPEEEQEEFTNIVHFPSLQTQQRSRNRTPDTTQRIAPQQQQQQQQYQQQQQQVYSNSKQKNVQQMQNQQKPIQFQSPKIQSRKSVYDQVYPEQNYEPDFIQALSLLPPDLRQIIFEEQNNQQHFKQNMDKTKKKLEKDIELALQSIKSFMDDIKIKLYESLDYYNNSYFDLYDIFKQKINDFLKFYKLMESQKQKNPLNEIVSILGLHNENLSDINQWGLLNLKKIEEAYREQLKQINTKLADQHIKELVGLSKTIKKITQEEFYDSQLAVDYYKDLGNSVILFTQHFLNDLDKIVRPLSLQSQQQSVQMQTDNKFTQNINKNIPYNIDTNNNNNNINPFIGQQNLKNINQLVQNINLDSSKLPYYSQGRQQSDLDIIHSQYTPSRGYLTNLSNNDIPTLKSDNWQDPYKQVPDKQIFENFIQNLTQKAFEKQLNQYNIQQYQQDSITQQNPFQYNNNSIDQHKTSLQDIPQKQYQGSTYFKNLNVFNNNTQLSTVIGDISNIELTLSNVFQTDHKDALQCIISLTNTIYVTGSRDCTLKLWAVGSKTPVATLAQTQSPVTCLAIIRQKKPENQQVSGLSTLFDQSLQGFMLAGTEGTEPKIYVLNAQEIKLIGELNGHNNTITSIIGLEDGRHAISTSLDGNIIIWDVLNGILINKKLMHINGVYAISNIKNYEKFVSSGADNQLQIWKLVKQQQQQQIRKDNPQVNFVIQPIKVIPLKTQASCLVSSILWPELIISGHIDGTISIWNGIDGFCEKSIKIHNTAITTLSLLEDETKIKNETDATSLSNISFGKDIIALTAAKDDLGLKFTNLSTEQVFELAETYKHGIFLNLPFKPNLQFITEAGALKLLIVNQSQNFRNFAVWNVTQYNY